MNEVQKEIMDLIAHNFNIIEADSRYKDIKKIESSLGNIRLLKQVLEIIKRHE